MTLLNFGIIALLSQLFFAALRLQQCALPYNAKYVWQLFTISRTKETTLLHALHSTCTNKHFHHCSQRYHKSNRDQHRALSDTSHYQLDSTVAFVWSVRLTLVHQLWPYLPLEPITVLCNVEHRRFDANKLPNVWNCAYRQVLQHWSPTRITHSIRSTQQHGRNRTNEHSDAAFEQQSQCTFGSAHVHKALRPRRVVDHYQSRPLYSGEIC